MGRLIIIAGPQAAGKSTVLAKLNCQPFSVAPLFPNPRAPLLFPIQESRQIIVHKHMLHGGIFMTPDHEREVVACDMERMDLMLKYWRLDLIHLDECNIFTIAHARAHGVDEVEDYWNQYITSLQTLKAAVIFLDISPTISWKRRQQRYERRLVFFPLGQRQAILDRYQAYLESLYPLLHDVYKRLPLPKVMIDGSCSEENVLKLVCESITRFIA